MVKIVSDYYIDASVLMIAASPECPELINNMVADILIKALGINGAAENFIKLNDNLYHLTWALCDGTVYTQVYSEKELLDAVKEKIIEYEIKVK